MWNLLLGICGGLGVCIGFAAMIAWVSWPQEPYRIPGYFGEDDEAPGDNLPPKIFDVPNPDSW